eukprot:CFRG1987T1
MLKELYCLGIFVLTATAHAERESYTLPCVHIVSHFDSLELGWDGQFSIQACTPLDDELIIDIIHPDFIQPKVSRVVLSTGDNIPVYVSVSSTDFGSGKVKILESKSRMELASFNVKVVKCKVLEFFSTVIGWCYFIAWSVSFYPQCIDNYRRKSVAGLSFDFVYLNLMGWICYAIYNVGLYSVPVLRNEYLEKYPGSDIPVKTNDVFFAIHAFLLTAFQLFYQMNIYDSGGQYLSRSAKFGLMIMGGVAVISALCASFGITTMLSFATNLSFLKVIITITKYIPQALYNYQRKSTVGWSIHNILLDITGGLLSIFQMLLIAYNLNDISGFFGNPAKFALGLVSIAFDVLFIIQHYVLYRHTRDYHSINARDFEK